MTTQITGSNAPSRRRRGSKRTKGGIIVDSLRLEDLQPFFSKNIAHVTKELGVGQTVLKRQCRKLGVRRWPSRELGRLHKLMEQITENPNDFTKEEAHGMLLELDALKADVLDGKQVTLPEWAKKLGHQRDKKAYNKRRKMLAKNEGALVDSEKRVDHVTLKAECGVWTPLEAAIFSLCETNN